MIQVFFIVLAFFVTQGVASQSSGAANTRLEEASNPRLLANVRLRYEDAEFDNLPESADALTLRARLGFEVTWATNTQFLVEGDFVRDLLGDFNDTTNGKTQFPVIADPDTTEINRLQLVNKSLKNVTFTVGRQRIILGDSRFVGNVGWRQNEQTYDAIRIASTPFSSLELDVSYVDQVNRIFGSESVNKSLDSNSWLFNATYKLPVKGASAKVVGHTYLLDLSNSLLSSRTVGLTGYFKKNGFSAKLAFSRQSDYGDQPVDYAENYSLVELSQSFGQFTGVLGYESLGGDGVRAFTTPMATLHKFNGFVDNFLSTPVDGLKDTYATIKYVHQTSKPFGPVTFAATYHDFTAENGSLDYGREFDFVASTKWDKFNFLFKYANYDADAFATDRQRFSLQIDYTY